MARISDAEIERLKDEVSLVRLVESSGVKLTRRGKDELVGCCPFHEDGTPSLSVSVVKNLFHCFGCQAAGGTIDWVMKREGVSFRHAVELLRADMVGGAPLDTPASSSSPVRATVRKLAAPVAFDADDAALLSQVVDYYHETLKVSAEGLDYLRSRGLDHPELIARFRLGLADRTLGLRLPEKNRKAGADIRGRLERIGVYRESGHEHFTGSLVVPVIGADEVVSEVYGRKIRNNLRVGTPMHLYLPGPHRGVWNLDGIAASGGEVILAEALIDAMTFWCAGYRNVTAAYGAGGLTEDHIAAFRAHGVTRVLIAFDRDAAGDKGAAEVAERLMAEGIGCYRIQFPKGMDANAYALAVKPAAKSLGVLIRKAEWLGPGKPPPRKMSSPVITVPPGETGEDRAEPSALSFSAAQSGIPASAVLKPEAELLPEPAPVLPASPMPAAPSVVAPEVSEREVVLRFGAGSDARRWRVRGLARNLAYDVLKVNLLASLDGGDDGRFHVDTLDLYNARARAAFAVQAAIELGLPEPDLRTDMGRVLLALEQLQDEAIRETLPPKAADIPVIGEAEREAALALLRAPDLPARILADFAACGIVGEATNKLVGYLAGVSRLLAAPLAVVIQSSSAAGKSSLMDAVLAFVPPEERVQYSAMTGQSLFYMGETSLKHRILAIAEEEGASRAAYALKLLQSEGELTIASTGSDPRTGDLVTREYRVEGPVMLMMTTTAIDIDEELMNRCLVLSVDEDRDQTRAIHALQREKRTLAGLVRRQEKQAVLDLHRNAQRLLRPLAVVNPYADRLTFLDDRTRTRRDHEKYLTLIDAITLLHQHQRPVRHAPVQGGMVEYIETTLDDIALANTLAHEVLGRSLDELPPQTRRMLAAVMAYVREEAEARAIRASEVRFSRADIRRRTGLADTQCRVHLDRLAALEYLLVHRGTRGQSFAYELLFDGAVGETSPRLAGLIDVEALRSPASQSASATASSRGEADGLAVPSRGHGGADAGPARGVRNAGTPAPARLAAIIAEPLPESRAMGRSGNGASYPYAPSPLAAATAAG